MQLQDFCTGRVMAKVSVVVGIVAFLVSNDLFEFGETCCSKSY